MCLQEWGTFLFFAAWNLVMTVWVYFLLPETKGIPIEDNAYQVLFARHPIWRRVMGKSARQVMEREAFRANAWREARDAEGGDLRQMAKYYATMGL
jgi:hypothetical protein